MKSLLILSQVVILASGCASPASIEAKVALTLTAISELQPTGTSVLLSQPTATPSSTPSPPKNETIPPFETEAQFPPLTATEALLPPSTVELSCLQLLEPQNGEKLASLGKQSFEWAPHPGAIRYLLEISPPDYHHKQTFTSEGPGLYRWMNTIPWAGEYSWQVTALDANGQILCVSQPSIFTKPRFYPTATGLPEPNSQTFAVPTCAP